MNALPTNTNPLEDQRLTSAVLFPTPDQPVGPEIPGVRDRMVQVREAPIRSRVFLGPTDAPIVLFFHGNGGTAQDYDHAAPDYASLPAPEPETWLP